MKVLFCSVTICHVCKLNFDALYTQKLHCNWFSGFVQYSLILVLKLTSRNIFSDHVIGLSDGHWKAVLRVSAIARVDCTLKNNICFSLLYRKQSEKTVVGCPYLVALLKLNYDDLSHVSVGEVRFIYFMKTCVTTWILKCKFGLKHPVFQRGNSNRGGLGAPNDCIMWNMCSKKQILPGIFYHLRKALNFLMTVPFMYNFRSSSDNFPKIFWSLIFHITLPRLGYFR